MNKYMLLVLSILPLFSQAVSAGAPGAPLSSSSVSNADVFLVPAIALAGLVLLFTWRMVRSK